MRSGPSFRPEPGVGWKWMAGVVAVASAYSPLVALTAIDQAPVITTLLLAFTSIFAVAVVLLLLLLRIGLDRRGATFAVALLTLGLTHTGGFTDYLSWVRPVLLALVILAAVIGYRLRGMSAFRVLMTWFVLTLLLYPTLTTLYNRVFEGQARADAASAIQVDRMSTKPDILLVVFDGYGSQSVLEEFYGFDNSPVLERLESLGFEAPGEITANYARTKLSVASVLQLDYVAEGGELSAGDLRELREVVAGESRFAMALRSNGYRQIHVESGWLGSRCGGSVDVCVEAPWPDETFFDIAYRSILRGMPGFELGRPFTEGALHVADWVGEVLPRYLADDIPDYIFVHLLLPHPPMFVDEDCHPNWRSEFSGYAVSRTGVSEQETHDAKLAYVKQVRCVNDIAIEIAESVGSEDAVVMIGDHGPDSSGQLGIDASQWTDAQKRERFGTFFAARVPDCDMGEIASLVNVGRRLLTCLGATTIPDLPTRTFKMDENSGRFEVFPMELSIPWSGKQATTVDR